MSIKFSWKLREDFPDDEYGSQCFTQRETYEECVKSLSAWLAVSLINSARRARACPTDFCVHVQVEGNMNAFPPEIDDTPQALYSEQALLEKAEKAQRKRKGANNGQS